MSNLLVLPNGNLIAPSMIKSVVRFLGKGVAIRNEFNKICDFIREPDDRRQRIIVEVLARILKTRDWQQPNWDEEFDTAP